MDHNTASAVDAAVTRVAVRHESYIAQAEALGTAPEQAEAALGEAQGAVRSWPPTEEDYQAARALLAAGDTP